MIKTEGGITSAWCDVCGAFIRDTTTHSKQAVYPCRYCDGCRGYVNKINHQAHERNRRHKARTERRLERAEKALQEAENDFLKRKRIKELLEKSEDYRKSCTVYTELQEENARLRKEVERLKAESKVEIERLKTEKEKMQAVIARDVPSSFPATASEKRVVKNPAFHTQEETQGKEKKAFPVPKWGTDGKLLNPSDFLNVGIRPPKTAAEYQKLVEYFRAKKKG